MKTLKLLAVVCPLLFACTPESMIDSMPLSATNKSAAVTDAANPLNPYDNVGALRNKILDTLFSKLPINSTNAQLLSLASAIAENEPGFITLKTTAYSPVTETALTGYIQYVSTPSQAVATLSLTQTVKADLEGFISMVLELHNQDYDILHAYRI